MSVIHDALSQLDDRERSSVGAVLGNNPKPGVLGLEVPEEVLNDFYDLKEYVRIANLRGQMRVISVASSLPNEGSTTIAAYLGFLLAGGKRKKAVSMPFRSGLEKSGVFSSEFTQEIKKSPSTEQEKSQASQSPGVLLVDTNMREPAVHRLFGLSAEDGLADILEGDLHWRKVVKSVLGCNLSIITAGQNRENPVELIASDRFRLLIKEWRKEFAFVVFDSAPILTSVEALSLSAIVDGVILVVRSGLTRWDNAQNAKRKLVAAHANLLGVALNRQRT
ncbi:CpsD/CapB family tyrosine-protein kinase [candidate division KSB1 bacterium]|nr:CpsD/CapB family tyrosine-protein kinase [candidate division KSB1 bacterium]